MRIAHITATFPPDYSGTGVVAYHNALGLGRRAHEVTVFTSGPPPQQCDDPPEIAVRRLPAAFRLGNAPFLPDLYRLKGFDLWHLHYPFYFGAETVYLRALRTGQPYVVTYHQDVLFRGLLRLPAALHHYWIGRRILGGARKVLATSLDYARASRLQEWMVRRPDMIGEMPNGVDARRFRPNVDGAAVRAACGLTGAQPAILFVGALDQAHYFKGVDVLLQALAALAWHEAHLLVVGEGNLRGHYVAQAAALGLQEQVTFCGRVRDADLPAHYAAADLLVLPSTTMGEAFGVVLLEAMACGKAVIASNLPGVRSVVTHREDGLLVAPDSVDGLTAALRTLLESPERRAAMGVKGRAKVEAHYDWAELIPRLEQHYAEALR